VKTERTIRNCGVRMKIVCPKTWDALDTTGRADVRHCSQCNEDVYFCATDAETIAQAYAGHRITRERPLGSELPAAILGGRPRVVTDEQRAALDRARREHGIDTLINGRVAGTTRACPDCSYPVPDFRKSCYVCGREVGRIS
jgi:hypothetical protein